MLILDAACFTIRSTNICCPVADFGAMSHRRAAQDSSDHVGITMPLAPPMTGNGLYYQLSSTIYGDDWGDGL